MRDPLGKSLKNATGQLHADTMQTTTLADKRQARNADDVVASKGLTDHCTGAGVRLVCVLRYEYRAIDDQKIGVTGRQSSAVRAELGGWPGQGEQRDKVGLGHRNTELTAAPSPVTQQNGDLPHHHRLDTQWRRLV